MARAENTEIIEQFVEFYRTYYRNEIGELAQKYPNEKRSLYVDWGDLFRFDQDIAEDYRAQPEQLQGYAEEALRMYDLPVDVSLGQAHVRVAGLPDVTEIREIRARHRGQLIAVQGIVRKATDVRPKVREAAFECQRCGTLTRIPQSGGDFQEPHECQGCERQGPFRINFDQSEFVDAQKIRVQESPEGLRGGETPQAIDVHIEDDITGRVTAGDHVRVTGVLHLDQQGNDRDKSPIFDVFMDGVTVEIEDEQFEDMDITEEDKKEIIALSDEPDIYQQMVESMAPSIFGYEQQKLAIILQLFSGVSKHLPDGSRIRGDLHMLLIGDPGTGKCVIGDTNVTLADGSEVPIRELVESNLDDPKPVDDGVWDSVDFQVPSMEDNGTMALRRATKVWKREAPEQLYKIRTKSGREVTVTPSHPLFVARDGGTDAVIADNLKEGQFVAVPRSLPTVGDDSLDASVRRSRANNAVDLDIPEQLTPWFARLLGYIAAEGHVQRHDRGCGTVYVTNHDREILDDVTASLERLGLNPTERRSHDGNDAREVVCSSSEFVSLLESLEPAFLSESSGQRIPRAVMQATLPVKRGFLRALIDAEGTVSPTQQQVSVTSTSRELLKSTRSLLLAFSIDSQLQSKAGERFRLRISGDDFARYVLTVGFVTERKQVAAEEVVDVTSGTNRNVVPGAGEQLRELREELGLTQADCGLPRSTYQPYERGDRNPSRESLQTVVETFTDAAGDRLLADGGPASGHRLASLRALGSGDVRWDCIESIEPVEPDEEWVYDLEVEGTHNYLTNNVVSHNSQLLQYVRNLAPRSVYTSGKGSSSAGLCVTGDTLVHTTDGFCEIRDLVSSDLPAPVDTETGVERAHSVYTFDRDTGRVDDRDSSYVWRMPEKPCRRIETSHGKELEASVDTPVLTCGAQGLEWTEISDVEAGDYVAVPRFEDLDRSTAQVRDSLELTTEKVKLTDASVEFVHDGLCREFGTLRDAAGDLGLSEDFVYDSLANRHVPLEKLDRILEAIDATRDDLRFDRVMLRHGDSIALPETFDADLMYLLGLVFGDGDISLDRQDGNRGCVRISNSDEALLERAADIVARKFDKRVDIEHQDESVPCIRIHSAPIARLFANAGMRTPKAELALDPSLTTAEYADAFLRGLMDADGSVSARTNGGSSVLFSTISEKLARQVQLMLETYGVRTRSHERDRRGTYEPPSGQTIESKHVQYFVECYGADVDRYAEAIGFELPEKQAALSSIVGTAERREETIPVGSALAAVDGPSGSYYRGDNPGRGRARAMPEDRKRCDRTEMVEEAVEADLHWDEVVAAVDTGEKEVFDLTVPGTHNFVGNGVVTHNTAAAVRDDFGDGQQWTLEAGALVLADQGIAAVDELDKMRCVTGDTRVQLGDRTTRICDFTEEVAETGAVEQLPNGRTIRDVDAEAWTMADDGTLVKRPVTAIHEYDAPETLTEVTLESGERLTSTPDHPYFVLEGGERVETPAEALSAGDWVYVPRRLPEPASDGGIATESGAVAPSVEADGGIDDELAAVLGYLAGDGNLYYDREEGVYGIRFTNAEEELLADFEAACREAFDAEPIRPPSEQRDDGVGTVRLVGREYADRVLEAGMNRETYDGKTLPEAVTASAPAAKAAFIRALADSEASVDTASVKVHSASYELLLGVKQLLLEFGISSQIQHREREERLDLYILAITSADSLAAFERHVGFTLERKQSDLETAVERTTGERTILDVIPGIGGVLADLRSSLRLHQSECGINATTYCEFENGSANVSIRKARAILDAFESRSDEAREDAERVQQADWDVLGRLREKYHVSQRELAAESPYTQQQVSRLWSDNEGLRETVEVQLRTVIARVAETELDEFRSLVYGDVKWRRVESVGQVAPSCPDDTVRELTGDLADLLGCAEAVAIDRAREAIGERPELDDRASIRVALDQYDITHRELALDLDVHQTTVSRWLDGTVETDRFPAIKEAAADRIDERLAEAEHLLDAIEARKQPSVYDLTVEGTHNFVANAVVVHNSEDRSAMHEALEQQSISISKAGINATLKSRCSLLGAANPKYGRFDQYEPIGEQIDLEPALISRFDLIFTVTDQPDEQKDRQLAEHIIQTNYAGELHTHRTESSTSNVSREEVENVTENVAPTIDAEFLRKYVAYAKRNCFPTMTEEAKEAIQDFYVDLRAQGQDDDAPVPVTARKLEALVRLAEASARIRLSDTVDAEDADRIIEIVRSSLEDVGMDPETGEFDADVIEAGTSKSQRDRIKNIKGIIEELEGEYDDGAPVEEVLDRAEEVGMERDDAEHEIEKLRRQGDVYEPKQDHLRTL